MFSNATSINARHYYEGDNVIYLHKTKCKCTIEWSGREITGKLANMDIVSIPVSRCILLLYGAAYAPKRIWRYV